MKDKGLHIIGEDILFNKWSVGDIPYDCITKSFQIKLQDIRAIAISPRFSFDDEILIITLIDKEKNFYQFSSYEFQKPAIKELEEKLKLESIRNVEWEKFSEEELDDGFTDKIIYPKELYGENLFLKPKGYLKTIISSLKFFCLKKSISGKMNPLVEIYLKKRPEY